ncbi:hypothetical protein [Nocardioides dilutus]
MTVVALLVVAVSACTDDSGDCCDEPLDPETSRELALAHDTWRDWASHELRAGDADGALVAAEAHFQPQDWSLPPSFRWELTFLSTRPSPPDEVARVLEKACAFSAGARFMLGDDLSVSLAVPAATRSVPSRMSSGCDSSIRGVATWLTYLDGHPLPPEVGGVEFIPTTSGMVMVTAYVRPPDATAAVARRIRRQLCAYPHGTRYSILRTAQPSPAGQMRAVRSFVADRTCRP